MGPPRLLSQLRRLWPHIEEQLNGLGPGKLLITGHSLGGALAVLTARAIADEGVRPDLELCGTYTFGQPMVGSRGFAKTSHAKLRLYRHEFGDDVVPYLPPHDVDDGYHHFGDRYAAARGDAGWQEPAAGGGEPTSSSDATLSDIAPALLALLIGRAPKLEGRHPLGLLWVIAKPFLPFVPRTLVGIGLAPVQWYLDWRGFEPRFSIDDHIPTHYVDLSRASLDRREA